jgi:hypothetical protein
MATNNQRPPAGHRRVRERALSAEEIARTSRQAEPRPRGRGEEVRPVEAALSHQHARGPVRASWQVGMNAPRGPRLEENVALPSDPENEGGRGVLERPFKEHPLAAASGRFHRRSDHPDRCARRRRVRVSGKAPVATAYSYSSEYRKPAEGLTTRYTAFT